MIKNLIINHFRGIEGLEIKDCGRINFLVGDNNIGKTSILDFIFLNKKEGENINKLMLNDSSDYKTLVLLIEENKQLIIDTLNFFPDFTVNTIEVREDGKIYIQKEEAGFFLPLNTEGNGFKKILFLISSIIKAQNGILLIDEIENSLHFSILEDMWETVFNMIKKFNVQIFITTHSLEILQSFSKAGVKAGKEIQESLRLYRIVTNKKKGIKGFLYNNEAFDGSIEMESEMR